MDLLLSQRKRWDQCWYISRNQKAPKSLVISLPYQSRPVEFLANFLQRWGADKEEHEKGSLPGQDGVSPVPHPAQVSFRSIHTQLTQRPVFTALSLQVSLEWRGVVARELHHSENVYLQRLNAVLKVPSPHRCASNRSKSQRIRSVSVSEGVPGAPDGSSAIRKNHSELHRPPRHPGSCHLHPGDQQVNSQSWDTAYTGCVSVCVCGSHK